MLKKAKIRPSHSVEVISTHTVCELDDRSEISLLGEYDNLDYFVSVYAQETGQDLTGLKPLSLRLEERSQRVHIRKQFVCLGSICAPFDAQGYLSVCPTCKTTYKTYGVEHDPKRYLYEM